MNRIVVDLAAPDLLAAYAGLSAGPKLILRLKSLLFLPTGKTVFLQCLTRSGLRAPDGRAWSSQTLNAVLDELLRQKLLTEELACSPALLHPVAVDTIAAEGGSRLAEAARKADTITGGPSSYTYRQQSDTDVLRRQIRLAVYTNNEKEFVAKRDLYDRLYAPQSSVALLGLLFSRISLATDWVFARSVLVQLAILQAKLSTFLGSGVAAPDLHTLIAHYRAQQDTESFGAVRPMLLYHDLLAGRLQEVRQGCSYIRNTMGGVPLVLEGATAFLSGDNQAALESYREALKLRRKQLGKRKLFLDDMHGLFFLMAMLRAKDATLHANMQAAFDAVLTGSSAYGAGFAALQALFWLVQGFESKAATLLQQLRAVMPSEPLSAACVALAEYVVDADLTRRRHADLAAVFDQIKNALPLVARIYAEILAETAKSPARYRSYLADTGEGFGIAFIQIVQVRQPWERALENLDMVLSAGSTKRDQPAEGGKSKRLAWFLDLQAYEI
ncbi:MAG: hypothetical protein ACRYG8_04515, partial [Janthinobacterium lividum]